METNEPLAYTIGDQPFLGLTIYLDSHPLIPRPETEWWVKKLLDEGYRKAAEILKKHKKKLDIIAAELVKKETIESEEFEQLMGGLKVRTVANKL